LKIVNDVRGSIDGWDFKQYVLGTLFYRFISENFSGYIEADDESVNYAELPDTVITDEIKDDAIKTKGYFIYPSQLFLNIAKNANDNENLNTDLAAIFSAIEGSANGYPSEVEYVAISMNSDAIAENDYNLSVSSYVEAKDIREKIDITVLNAAIKTTVGKIDQLRIDIDEIVAEIEGVES